MTTVLDELPAPLTPADCDLRSYHFMPLEITRLMKSRAWLRAKRRPELAFYMMNLWAESWHQVPAASLEDDDDVLADLAKCDPDKWITIRTDVLHGWIKCADGRLYHPVVAEKAVESWHGNRQQCKRTEAARRKALEVRALRRGLSVTESVTDSVTESNRDGDREGQGEETPKPPHASRAETTPKRAVENGEPATPQRAANPSPQRDAAEPPKRGNAEPPGFTQFWDAFPLNRRGSRSKCLRLWTRKKLESHAVEILAGLARWKASHAWAKDNGEYIHGPMPWLNDEKWLAHPPPAKKPVTGAGASGVDRTRKELSAQAEQVRQLDEQRKDRDRVLGALSDRALQKLTRQVIVNAGDLGSVYEGKDPNVSEPLRWKIYELVKAG